MKEVWLDQLDPQRTRNERTVIYGDCELTHDEANDWLQRVDENHQRNLGRSIVERYRRDMNAGNWAPGTNLIAFDGKGRMFNGQHTLTAFAGSNLKTLWVIWTINRHEKAYLAFDYLRKRTPADALKWEGHDKSRDLPPMATALWQYETGCFDGKSFKSARSKFPTTSDITRIVDMHPRLAAHIHRNPFPGKEFSQGAMNAASYIFSTIDDKRGKRFFEMFLEGIGFETPRDPILVLRKEFMAMPEHTRERHGVTLLKFFKAWNAWVRGEAVPGKLIKPNDIFEHPIDPKDREPTAPPYVVQ